YAHYPLPYFYFFFYSSCHPRHLHSFPTRRSSDLADRSSSTSGAVIQNTETVEGLRDLQRARAALGDIRLFDGPALGHAGQRRVLDRKSTRLNSSHVAISYAVFCLKKKKKKKKSHK